MGAAFALPIALQSLSRLHEISIRINKTEVTEEEEVCRMNRSETSSKHLNVYIIPGLLFILVIFWLMFAETASSPPQPVEPELLPVTVIQCSPDTGTVKRIVYRYYTIALANLCNVSRCRAGN